MGRALPVDNIILAVPAAMLTQAIESKSWKFHLMYLSEEHMNLNFIKWLANSRADIVIRYNFNQVREC